MSPRVKARADDIPRIWVKAVLGAVKICPVCRSVEMGTAITAANQQPSAKYSEKLINWSFPPFLFKDQLKIGLFSDFLTPIILGLTILRKKMQKGPEFKPGAFSIVSTDL
jgi:hypothetical protein